ncbi:hypothetical protein [Pseudomonas fluorescens]|uniref:Uncharacterized protein n=1 Tax=Pseudomonas fluorescens TaxID=294 RepID=A0A423MKB1_PSEFL|nr:hypothetical protein [Pseudomonas fluorescens]RON85040.1 hypothetical protein BK670_03850 [Pseudomonas fluorescens]
MIIRKTNNRRYLAIGASLGFCLALSLAIVFLLMCKFSGAEFTAFVISFAVLAIAVGFAPELQEISIVGNVVKLKEVKADAMKAIESLTKSRVETLRVLVRLIVRSESGPITIELIDPRVPEFWRVIDLAKEYDCLEKIRREVLLGIPVLLLAQMEIIILRSHNRTISSAVLSKEILDPQDLIVLANDKSSIQSATQNFQKSPHDKLKLELKICLAEYSRLYQLKEKLEALSN